MTAATTWHANSATSPRQQADERQDGPQNLRAADQIPDETAALGTAASSATQLGTTTISVGTDASNDIRLTDDFLHQEAMDAVGDGNVLYLRANDAPTFACGLGQYLQIAMTLFPRLDR